MREEARFIVSHVLGYSEAAFSVQDRAAVEEVARRLSDAERRGAERLEEEIRRLRVALANAQINGAAQVSIELRVYLAAEAAMMAADDAGSDLGDLLRHAIMDELWERLTDDERVRLLARSADDVVYGRVPPEGVA